MNEHECTVGESKRRKDAIARGEADPGGSAPTARTKRVYIIGTEADRKRGAVLLSDNRSEAIKIAQRNRRPVTKIVVPDERTREERTKP